MIDSFSPPPQGRAQALGITSPNTSGSGATGNIRALGVVTVLSFVPTSTSQLTPSSPQNLEQLLARIGKQPLLARISGNGQSGGQIINLTSPLGNFQVKPLAPFSLPIGSQVEIFADGKNTHLRQLINTSSSKSPKLPPSPSKLTTTANNQASFIGKPLQGLVIQSTPRTSPLIANIATPQGPAITSQSLAFIRSILHSTATSPTPTSSPSHSSSIPLVFAPHSSVSTSAPLFHGTITQLNNLPNQQNATISFFAGFLRVPFTPQSQLNTAQIGSNISFTLAQGNPQSNPQGNPQGTAPSGTFSSQVSIASFTPLPPNQLQTALNPHLNSTKSPTATTNLANPSIASSINTSSTTMPTNQQSQQALTTGTPVTIRIQSALPYQGQTPTLPNTPTTPLSPATLSGVLTSQTIATSSGVIRLDSPLPLPQGTNIQFTLSPQNPQNPSVIPLAQTIAETLDVLFSPSAPQTVAPGTIQTLIPQIQSPLMIPSLLFLLSALGRGSPEQWLGNQQLQQTLQTRNPSLYKRLQQQFKLAAQPSRSSSPSQKNWQWFSLPIADSNALDHVLFARYHQDADTQKKSTTNENSIERRFRIASRFSRLGSFQIEGRIQTESPLHPPLKKRTFSLMIAAEGELPTTVEQDIRQIVASLGDALHLEHTVIFRNSLDPSWHE